MSLEDRIRTSVDTAVRALVDQLAGIIDEDREAAIVKAAEVAWSEAEQAAETRVADAESRLRAAMEREIEARNAAQAVVPLGVESDFRSETELRLSDELAAADARVQAAEARAEEAAAKARQLESDAQSQADTLTAHAVDQARQAQADAESRSQKVVADAEARAAAAEAKLHEHEADLQARADMVSADAADKVRQVEAHAAARAQLAEADAAARAQTAIADAEARAQKAVAEAEARAQKALADADAQVREAAGAAEALLQKAHSDAESRIQDLQFAADARAADSVTAAVTTALARERESGMAGMSRLVESIRGLDGATSRSEVFDALALAAGREAARAAVITHRGDRLQGWKLSGFGPRDTHPKGVDMPLDDDGVIGQAVHAARTVTTRGGVSIGPSFDPLPIDRMGLAVPLIVEGRVIGVVYADGVAAEGQELSVPSGWPEVIEVLARHAGRCLEALAARKATGGNGETPPRAARA